MEFLFNFLINALLTKVRISFPKLKNSNFGKRVFFISSRQTTAILSQSDGSPVF